MFTNYYIEYKNWDYKIRYNLIFGMLIMYVNVTYIQIYYLFIKQHFMCEERYRGIKVDF